MVFGMVFYFITWLCIVLLSYLLVDWYRRQPTLGSLSRRFILVTGCDTGFGHMLTKRLDALGCHVIATCLTESGKSELKEACTNRVKTVIMDVTDPACVRKMYDYVVKILPVDAGLWGLVNNAGLGSVSAGPLEWLRTEDFRQILDVNTLGMIDVTLTFLPLVKKAHGRIINMSSASGRLPGPLVIPYVVSKFGVEAFSDALRQHLRCFEHDVTVHIIEPGMYQTPIVDPQKLRHTFEYTWNRLPLNVRNEYGEPFYKSYVRYTLSSIQAMTSPHMHQVVDAYVHALTAKHPRLRYSVGVDAVFAVVLSYLPSWIIDWIICKTNANNQNLHRSTATIKTSHENAYY